MRFTEYELTAALTGAAKSVIAGRKARKQGLSADEAWEAMDRYERFQVLDAIGDQVLPVLTALPDIEVTPGTRPTYTNKQVQAAVEERLGDGVRGLRGKVVVKARTALVQTALAHVPPRQDPDALIQGDESS